VLCRNTGTGRKGCLELCRKSSLQEFRGSLRTVFVLFVAAPVRAKNVLDPPGHPDAPERPLPQHVDPLVPFRHLVGPPIDVAAPRGDGAQKFGGGRSGHFCTGLRKTPAPFASSPLCLPKERCWCTRVGQNAPRKRPADPLPSLYLPTKRLQTEILAKQGNRLRRKGAKRTADSSASSLSSLVAFPYGNRVRHRAPSPSTIIT
jgi:hypothetical protein